MQRPVLDALAGPTAAGRCATALVVWACLCSDSQATATAAVAAAAPAVPLPEAELSLVHNFLLAQLTADAAGECIACWSQCTTYWDECLACWLAALPAGVPNLCGADAHWRRVQLHAFRAPGNHRRLNAAAPPPSLDT
jgi:hypothetical protein